MTMNRKNMRDQRLGILGAGQLGKMLCQRASQWNLKTILLDKSSEFPAAGMADEFITGDFTDAQDVAKLIGRCDRATIEIEKVSSEGLRKLRASGISVQPNIESLDVIKDKGLQKNFYRDAGFPSSAYRLISTEAEIKELVSQGKLPLPFVLKSRTGGYDGKGVQIVKTVDELDQLISGPYLIEELVDIAKELAVIAVANERGEVRSFPMVEMLFDPKANLVDYLICPSDVSPAIENHARQLAESLIAEMKICGLLSVEMFLTSDGEILINEVAPRPHNSGHHTIEACNHSQYEMHLRGVMNWPLPEIELVRPAAMLNILGTGEIGKTMIQGWQDLMTEPNVYPHIYGKNLSKPYRKMGHITVTGTTIEEVKQRSERIKGRLRVSGRTS